MNTIKRYTALMRWFIPDSILRFKGFSLFVMVMSTVGIAFQLQIFGIIIYYAKHFSSGDNIVFQKFGFNLDFDPRSSALLLVTLSVALLISLLMSAIAIYLSRWGTLRLQRKYNEVCSRRVVELLTTGILRNNVLEGHRIDLDRDLSRLAMNDSRMCGWVLRLLLDLIVPFGTLVVAFSVLIHLDNLMTINIIVFIFGYSYFQYHISRRAAHCSVRFEQIGPTARRDFNLILRNFKMAPDGALSPIKSVDEIFAGGSMDKMMDAYVGRVQSIAESRLISGVFMAVVLSLILLVMGTGIINSGSGWGRLLIYIVALRFAMTNLQSIFGQITAINRFYPQVNRYCTFIKNSFVATQEKSEPCLEYTLHAENSLFEGSLSSITIRVDYWLAIVGKLDLNRYNIGIILGILLGNSESILESAFKTSRYATSRHSCPNCTLRQLIGIHFDAEWIGWNAYDLPQKLIIKFDEQLPDNLDEVIDSEIWENVDPDVKLILSILSFLESDCQWLLIEGKGLRYLDKDTHVFLQSRLKGRIVVIVFKGNFSNVGNYNEQSVAILDDNSLVGLGSPKWFASVEKEVQSYLNIHYSKLKTDATNTDDFDDDIL